MSNHNAQLSNNEEAQLVRKYRKALRNEVELLGGNPSAIKRWQVTVNTMSFNQKCSSGEPKQRVRTIVMYRTGGKSPKVFRSRCEAMRFLGLLKNDVKKNVTVKKEVAKGDSKAGEGVKRKSSSKRGDNDSSDDVGSSSKYQKKNDENKPSPNNPSPVREAVVKKLQTRPLRAWQRAKLEVMPIALRSHVNEYLLDGWTVFKRVLPPRLVTDILRGTTSADNDDAIVAASLGLRARKGNQRWMGAIKTIAAYIKTKSNTETVLSPLTTRDHGRYDMPLPREACIGIEACLKESNIFNFVYGLLNNKGRMRTQDIMLSRPGSAEQKAHTDSSWEGKPDLDPKTHYMTILIPLTRQDKQTGGTRVWPRSHRCSQSPDWTDYIDMVEPALKTGDALVFDGLLTHLGMSNVSSRDRYFYYAAFATGHDHNTDVTGH